MVTVIETAGYENDGQPKTVGGDAWFEKNMHKMAGRKYTSFNEHCVYENQAYTYVRIVSSSSSRLLWKSLPSWDLAHKKRDEIT